MQPSRNLVFLVLSTALIGMAACSRGASGDEPFSWEDDFADPSSGWPRRSSTGWTQDYEEGIYRVAIDQGEWTYALGTATAGLDVGDVILEVDVRFASNYEDAKAGVICRYLDGDNYYSFVPQVEIRPNGFAAPAYRGAKNSRLVRAFLWAIRAAGGQPSFVLKTGTADMNVVAPAWGCPALAYGPGDSSLDHTPNGHVLLSEYGRAVSVVGEALRGLRLKGLD